MENKVSSKKIISGLGWSFGERILAQGVSFVVSIVLARLLAPEEYGIISLILVFINLANVFVANGFGESLIQKKEATQKDFSTIFWCTFVFSCILYAVLFFAAPFIGSFYGNMELVPVLRVLSLKIPLASINTIQHAYVSRHMQFKKFFFSTLSGTIISGVVGIIMAYRGLGVWALVAQYLVNSSMDTIILLITVPWHPKFEFDNHSAKSLINYSWKVTAGAFINELYSELRSLIIGKVYSSADLAYYNKGNQFPSLFITNVNSAINTVFFPVMSTLQNKIEELKALAKKTLRISSYIIFPLMLGLMGIADSLVSVLLTDKWLPCVPYIRILCLYWITQPLQTINWQLLKAVGRSDLCLKLEVVKKAIGFLLIFATMFISVEALAWSTALFALISAIINMLPNRKLVNYSLREQFKDIAPNFLLSSIMGLAVWFLSFMTFIPTWILLCIQVTIGVAIYVSMSVFLKNESFMILYNFILPYLKAISKKLHKN